MKKIVFLLLATTLITTSLYPIWPFDQGVTRQPSRPTNNSVVIKPKPTNLRRLTDGCLATWNCSVVDEDGTIIVGGTYQGKDGNHFTIAWITPGTTIAGSTVIIPMHDEEAAEMGGDQCFAIALDKSGNVFLGGSSATLTGSTHFAVVKIKKDKTVDQKFGHNGMMCLEFCIAGGVNDRCTSLAVDKKGNIVAAGTSSDMTGANYFALMRLTPEGHPDRTLGKRMNGVHFIAPTLAGGVNDMCNKVTLDPKDGIILSGTSSDIQGNSFFASIRFPFDQRW